MEWVLKDKTDKIYLSALEFDCYGIYETVTEFQKDALRFNNLEGAKEALRAVTNAVEIGEEFKIYRLTGNKKTKALICDGNCKYMETYVLELQDNGTATLYLKQCDVSKDGFTTEVTFDLKDAIRITQPIVDETAKCFADEVATALNTIENCYPYKSIKLPQRCVCNSLDK